MKLLSLGTMFLLCTSLAGAQISITMTDVQGWFVTGKSWRIMEADSVNATMNVGTASSSAQSWIAPSLQYNDTVRFDNAVPSATPYGAQYPLATNAQQMRFSDEDVTVNYYNYTRLANDSLIDLGTAWRYQGGGFDSTFFYYESSLQVVFPVTYGRVFSRRDSTPSFGGGYVIIQETETFDAFGTITLPTGTFQALRSKWVEITESYFPGVPTSRDTLIGYEWITKEGYQFAAELKNPQQASGNVPLLGGSFTSIITTPTSVEPSGDATPVAFELHQNFPNPFNPTTSFEFQVSSFEFVSIKVFDILGREVAVLVNEVRAPGIYKLTWDASALPSGVYLYRMQAENFVETRKMTLMK